jgi:hypothetical protein
MRDHPHVAFGVAALGRRLALLVAVLLALAHAPSARADGPPCSGGGVVHVAAALHTLRRADDGLVHDARFVIDPGATLDFAGGAIPFAVPLPVGERLRPADGLSPIVDPTGRVTGICVAPEGLRDGAVVASFSQPLALRAGTRTTFGAPVAAGGVVQILDPSRAFDPRSATLSIEITSNATAANDLLERHVGFVAARGIGHDAREEARRRTDLPLDLVTRPVYVRGDDVAAAGGLSARIGDAPARSRTNAVAVAVAFAAVVGALVLAARRLRDAATVERADAWLAADIAELDRRRRRL